jgi:hypothetical protein
MRRETGSLRISVLVVAFFTLLFGLGQLPAPGMAKAQEEQGGEPAVEFRWALGALVGAGEEEKLVPIKQDTALKSGDQLKMLVDLEKKCFVYVLHQNARGELKLLFPYSLQQFATSYEVGKKYYIPRGDDWLRLGEEAGSETIHLLASVQRIEAIENLWIQYDSAEALHKPEIAKLILSEIRDEKKQNRELSLQAERPVTIGGNVRSLQEPDPLDVATIADGITANSFYGRTFTIDHQ